MKKLVPMLVATCLLFAGCGSGGDQGTSPETDSLVVVDSVPTGQSPEEIEELMAPFVGEYIIVKEDEGQIKVVEHCGTQVVDMTIGYQNYETPGYVISTGDEHRAYQYYVVSAEDDIDQVKLVCVDGNEVDMEGAREFKVNLGFQENVLSASIEGVDNQLIAAGGRFNHDVIPCTDYEAFAHWNLREYVVVHEHEGEIMIFNNCFDNTARVELSETEPIITFFGYDKIDEQVEDQFSIERFEKRMNFLELYAPEEDEVKFTFSIDPADEPPYALSQFVIDEEGDWVLVHEYMMVTPEQAKEIQHILDPEIGNCEGVE